jgi:hypothetical protein
LARERGWVLTWDKAHWLALLDHTGHSQAQRRFPGLVAACAADDASAYAAAGMDGELWWLAPDLMARWERKLSHRALALALDPFGQYLAVADIKGRVLIYDRQGQTVARLELPRPLAHLAFVPGAAFLVGSADYGLVTGFNLRGEVLWREGLVARVGGLSTEMNGRHILLACFNDGLHQFNESGRKQTPLTLPEPCHLVSQSFDGDLILAATLHKRLYLLERCGKTVTTFSMPQPIVGLALGPLGRDPFVALDDGSVVRLEVQEKA